MGSEPTSWREDTEVLPVFPTFVWKTTVAPPVQARIESGVLPKLEAFRVGLPALGPGQSWQSEHTLHELDDFAELIDCVKSCARSVLAFLKTAEGELEITGCWANVNGPGAAHRMHSHPNNYLSGVYYLQTRPGADTVNFHDPRSQTAIIRAPVTELTGYNTDQVVVQVADGTVLLFPAWLAHSVDPNRSDRERISVSFNLMFSDYTRRMAKPVWEAGIRRRGE